MRPENIEELLRRNRELEARLDEAEETLRAIRSGEVDAIVADGPDGDVVYTLKGADEGYRLLVEQMAEGAVTLAADGVILFANGQLARMLGLPLERVMGSRIDDLVTPAGRSILAGLLSAADGSKSELDLRRDDGELVPVYVAANRLQLDGLACTTLVITDLTEQRRNEEIVAAGKLARSILEQAAAAILVLDPDGRIIQANHAAEGLAGGSVLLRSFSSAFRLSSGPEAKDLTFEELRSAVHKDGTIRGLQAIAHLHRGGMAPIILSAGRFTTLGSESLGYVITLYDLSDLKQAEEALRKSEEHFRRLYDANIVGIVRANSEQIIDSNDMFLQMTGYTREDLRAGKIRWREMTPAEQAYLDERGLAELTATGSCKPFEKEIVRKDGARLSILLGATALDKSPLTWLGFVVDLTERKELERRLVEKQKLEGIGLLAGGIAHDFNNLLVGILGNASLAQDMVPRASDVGRTLDAIVKASERAAHLTRQMLAYSGRGQFVIEPVNLSDLVQEMTRLLNPSIPSNVSVQFDLARSLRPVLADSGQLQQIVMNLVINAAEAIGEQPGSISIRTRMRNVDPDFIRAELGHHEIEPGTYVSLEVSDSGSGMDAGTVTRIFDPFFTTKFTGRGLGLAAVSGIVRGHKGAIKVTTAPGEGTTFLVLLPAASEPSVEAPKQSPADDLKGTATVLIVDDEDVVLRTAQKALERHGFCILTAANGAAGIDVLNREKDRISLIVLDLSMPGMTGQQALPRIRAIKPDVPVLVSSGFSEIEALRVFEGQHLAGFIQKPYTVGRLVEKVKAALSEA